MKFLAMTGMAVLLGILAPVIAEEDEYLFPTKRPIPDQDKCFIIKCDQNQHKSADLKKLVSKVVPLINKGHRFPDEPRLYNFEATGSFYSYPILPNLELYDNGTFPTDYVLFNEDEVVVGGMRYFGVALNNIERCMDEECPCEGNQTSCDKDT
ncbi:BgTH12-05890 [Blumeria graminis f. sp. triticale]|uniref:BgtE-5632 n=3 Tax=Blumeria graminis TaxID=34373 RepID=A0A061HL03_BLUGR|nr:putative secreted effector protein [Blumeria graminis f. sp. tritici 96224]CAD6504155.1 BgTH12-05890 [Blumeria graminis f. sp. triticale]VDB90925.1 BgtE-5632 [Blumeria graminis f. sp. tritici]